MSDVLDIIGVGLGPSNLALAIAVDEHNQTAAEPVQALFLEQQPAFGWHRGMLLHDATMQVSFLKDLVTMRNPASDYSFLAYLHARDRLTEFINHKTLFPLRIEFHDYLEWAAVRVAHAVRYGEKVVGVEPVVDDDGRIAALDVVSRGSDDQRSRRRARNVVVATGLVPHLPPGAAPGDRVWHNRDLLPRVRSLPLEPTPRRFVVVGAGQSAAEAVAYLHQQFPTAEVCSVFRPYGYVPSDDTPFANRIFDPAAVDEYFDADDEVKQLLFRYHRNTNYSVVDGDLIDELYRREYREQVTGARRLRMMRASEVVGVEHIDRRSLQVAVRSLTTRRVETLEADALVYATGYRPVDPADLLGDADRLVCRRPDGAPMVERDYRVQLTLPSRAAVYLQGGTEHTHGLSSSLLSNVAVRAGEIVASVVARRVRPPVPVEVL